jgi:nitrate/nitrite transport system ATP-binding protein
MSNTSTISLSDEGVSVVDEDLLDQDTKPVSIQINNVTVSFKTPKGIYTAVKEIDLTVRKGEIVALIGHSGCGKSTLMSTISGMVKPTSGEVFANGQKVTSPGPDRGIVFQNYSLLPWLTVYKNIYVAVDAALKDKTTAEKITLVETNLKMVNLWEHKDKLPGQLSGGMKQRVAIARAFSITTYQTQYILAKRRANAHLPHYLAYVFCVLFWLVRPGTINANHPCRTAFNQRAGG